MDGNDELGFTFGGGNRTAGSGLQLSLFDTILTEDEQKNIVQKAAQEIFGAAFAMPEQIIDEVLCDGSNDKNSIIESCIEFSNEELNNIQTQFETAKTEAERPFPQESELQEKTKRLAAVEALLKMDKKDTDVIDTDVSDIEISQQRREYAMAR